METNEPLPEANDTLDALMDEMEQDIVTVWDRVLQRSIVRNTESNVTRKKVQERLRRISLKVNRDIAALSDNQVSKKIELLMQIRGWNQGELARQLEVSRPAISLWLSGTRSPRSPMVRVIDRLIEESKKL